MALPPGHTWTSPAAYFHPANLLTYGGLATAVVAVGVALQTRDWRLAGAGLAAAAVADLLDGRFASWFSRSTDHRAFGVQLDSLADAAAFGAAPALAALVLADCAGIWRVLLPVAVAAYLVAALTRLGAFNVEDSHDQFVGIPTTVAGLLCSTFFLFEPSAPALTLGLAACAVGMVAPLAIPRPRGVTLVAVAVWGGGLICLHLLA